MLLDNGYPRNVINIQITEKITQFSTLKRFGSEKCLHKLGKRSQNRHGMLPVVRKGDLPTIQKSSVIYEYKCYYDSR